MGYRQQSLSTHPASFERETVAVIRRETVAFDLIPSLARTACEGPMLSGHGRVEAEHNAEEIFLWNKFVLNSWEFLVLISLGVSQID